MLDFFADLDIEDNTTTTSSFCNPSSYTAELHDSCWFLNAPDSRDVHLYRATFFYESGSFQFALEEFKKHLNHCDHNRVHLVTIYDSLVNCAAKTDVIDKELILQLLVNYKDLVLDYGDQLQFFKTAINAYKVIGGNDDIMLKYIIVLCATIDLPENWLLFGNFQSEHPNFLSAFHIRALALSSRHLSCSKGFAHEAINHRLRLIREQLNLLHLTEEQTADAKLHMVRDLMSNDDRQSLGEEVKLPAHDCRSKIGKFKSDAEIDSICKSFRERFSFMFS